MKAEQILKACRMLPVAMTLGLPACVSEYLPYPKAVTVPGTAQIKLQSAAHWDLLANNEAQYIADALPAYATVHVSEEQTDQSPFHQAYHQFLISNLNKRGTSLLLNSAEAGYHVDYAVQTLTHQRRDRQKLLPPVASAFWIGASLMDKTRRWSNPELALLPLAAGLDIWNMYSPFTREETTEVIITTRVHNRNRVILSDSRVYYFDAGNMTHYHQSARSFPVVGAADLP